MSSVDVQRSCLYFVRLFLTGRDMNELLERAAEKAGSYSALAQQLNVSRQWLSDLKRNRRPLPPELAADLAEMMGEDPVTATIEAHAAQSKSNADREKWERRLRRITASAAALMLGVVLSFGHSQPAEARIHDQAATNLGVGGSNPSGRAKKSEGVCRCRPLCRFRTASDSNHRHTMSVRPDVQRLERRRR
jgi:plasmid maintenance system antidote protein VapI